MQFLFPFYTTILYFSAPSNENMRKSCQDGSFTDIFNYAERFEIPFNTNPIIRLYVHTAPTKKNIVICFTIL